ncbi:MAG: ankyrin repeat domain-containing protein [Clostridiales bacterium]|nr:ankyrin repeat domain-containing protein [Clostridiales bacterium]
MKCVIDDENKLMKIFLNVMTKESKLKEFIACCGDVNCKDDLGRTMLHYAVLKENLIAVGILIESNANVNEVDNDLRSPMHYAAVIGNKSIVKYLIKHTNVVYAQDLYGQTPECLAKWRGNIGIFNMIKVCRKNINVKAS